MAVEKILARQQFAGDRAMWAVIHQQALTMTSQGNDADAPLWLGSPHSPAGVLPALRTLNTLRNWKGSKQKQLAFSKSHSSWTFELPALVSWPPSLGTALGLSSSTRNRRNNTFRSSICSPKCQNRVQSLHDYLGHRPLVCRHSCLLLLEASVADSFWPGLQPVWLSLLTRLHVSYVAKSP